MKKYVRCSCCDRPIWYADALHDADTCYKIDDDYICEDCIREYVDSNFKYELEEDEPC